MNGVTIRWLASPERSSAELFGEIGEGGRESERDTEPVQRYAQSPLGVPMRGVEQPTGTWHR